MNDPDKSINQNPYLLLTPGPLSTTPTVKEVMLRDWCTWDEDYNVGVVQVIRRKLVELATAATDARARHTAVLMQGSGTFSVESVIGSVIPPDGRLLVVANGAYGQRIAKIARALRIDVTVHDSGETAPPDFERLATELDADPGLSHVAMVHGETTTGMLNDAARAGGIVKNAGRTFILDAMCTFGGIPIDVDELGVDFLVSSANKCIQGVPGFGFIIARRETLEACEGCARSLSLDLHDQWRVMEQGSGGKWRFTSPTHVVRAFARALEELDDEGGVAARNRRYTENQNLLVDGMEDFGFQTLLPREMQSPIITAFHNPDFPDYRFNEFYLSLKSKGFVIYPGKVTGADTFRIGTIGDVHPGDIEKLLAAIRYSRYWV